MKLQHKNLNSMKRKFLLSLAIAFGLAGSVWADLTKVDGVYQIGSAQDLREFATTVNGGEYGASAVLISNVDLNNEAWTPIGNATHPYTGTFDGLGHEIIGFSLTTTSNQQGFFGQLGDGAIVKNFTIDGSVNSSTNNNQHVGGVIGGAGSSTGIVTISSIHSKVHITCSNSRHGGILGTQTSDGTVNIDHCRYSGTLDAGNITGNLGGIVGFTRTKDSAIFNITNCLFDGVINDGTGDNAGGIVGYTNSTKVTITNCLSKGSITTSKPGQFFGQLNGKNAKLSGTNYFIDGIAVGNLKSGVSLGGTAATQVTSEQVTSGALCYLLNENTSNGQGWYQTLSGTNKENSPVPVPSATSLKVYYDTSSYLNFADNQMSIANESDLKRFATIVNAGGFDLNAKLTANITPLTSWPQSIGNWVNSACYKGHFDGQGYTIGDSEFIYTTARNYHGIFGVLSAGAVVENFKVRGRITNSSRSNIGVIGYTRDTEVNIRNIQSYLTITNSGTDKHVGGILGSGNAGTTNIDRCAFFGEINATGKTNAGGIVGYFTNGSSSIVNITNCLFKGIVTSSNDESNCGGIAGYGGENVNNVKIKNCLSIGSVTGTTTKKGQFFGNILNSSSSITNCYYQGNNIKGTGSSDLTTSDATVVTDEQLASGEVCYALNGDQSDIAWYQTLPASPSGDATPTLDSTHDMVYVNGTVCPDTNVPQGSVSYSNVDGTTVGSHDYVDGFCSYCNFIQSNYITPSDGWYVIGNEKQLKWFGAYVNAGNTGVNGKLTDNIDLEGIAWTPIGNSTNKYTGIFDGQNYTITNFSYTATGDNNGLFGYINNATIKNFSIGGVLTSGYNKNGVVGYIKGLSTVSRIHSSLTINVPNCKGHTGGIVGGDEGATTDKPVVEYCEYSGTLTHSGTGDCQAGILGYTGYGTVRNCIFSGTISGESSRYAGILGYCKQPSFGGVQNCLSIGKIHVSSDGSNKGAIIGTWNGDETANVKNNYYCLKEGSNITRAIGGNTDNCEAPVNVTADQLSSGEVAYKLGTAFYQTIGSDNYPVLDSTHGVVAKIADCGYGTLYAADTDVTIPSGITAYAGKNNGTSIKLTAIADKIKAGEAVVLVGDEGFYSFMPTTGASDVEENDLEGSDGTVTTDDSYIVYALANKTNGVGFYKVNAGVKVPAGRAYFKVSTGASAKAFYLFGEENETAIKSLTPALSEGEGAIYNLAGQRISKLQKGFNIVNGKKVLF